VHDPVEGVRVFSIEAEEDVAQGSADWASEEEFVSASLDGALDEALLIEQMIAAGEGKR
jgi:hypothetical protein